MPNGRTGIEEIFFLRWFGDNYMTCVRILWDEYIVRSMSLNNKHRCITAKHKKASSIYVYTHKRIWKWKTLSFECLCSVPNQNGIASCWANTYRDWCVVSLRCYLIRCYLALYLKRSRKKAATHNVKRQITKYCGSKSELII